MALSFKKFLETYMTNGRLAVSVNLLFDMVLIGWCAFSGLYTLEVLLPTFVTARFSLVKFAIALLLLTTLLVWLGSVLGIPSTPQKRIKSHQRYLASIILASIGVIALAHYRFPWWSIPIMVAGYGLTVWLLLKSSPTHH